MGRPVEWGFDRLGKLLDEVDAIKSASGGTDREALARLAEERMGTPGEPSR